MADAIIQVVDQTVTVTYSGAETVSASFVQLEALVADAAAEAVAASAAASAAELSAAGVASASASATLAARHSGNLPPGFIDLSDKPVAAAECAYWDVVPYNDGVKTWPMRKVEAGFHEEWHYGGVVKRDAAGDLYMSVDIARMNDPTRQVGAEVVQFFVNRATGTDTTAGGQGLSEGLPWRKPTYALTQAVALTSGAQIPEIIILDEAFIGSDGFPCGTYSITKTMKIHFRTPSGARSRWLAQMRESVSLATMAWVDNADGSFESDAAAVADAIKNSPGHFDAVLEDVDGIPLPMRPAVDAATSQATPNSSFNEVVVGASNDVLTMHRLDRTAPDPATSWIYMEGSAGLTFQMSEGVTLYLGGRVLLVNNYGAAALPMINIKPTTVVPATWTAHTCRFFAEDIDLAGGSSGGILIQDMEASWVSRLRGKHMRKDLFNLSTFHHFAASGDVREGNYMHGGASDIVAGEIGENYFLSQPALTLSNQGWTTHTRINALFFNCYAENVYGAISAHVAGAQVAEFNSSINYPTNPVQVLPLAAGESPRCGVWADNTGAATVDTAVEMIYPSIRVDGGGFDYCATGDGVISVWGPRGGTTTETGTGGQVLDGETGLPL